jgi:hypothetical protein
MSRLWPAIQPILSQAGPEKSCQLNRSMQPPITIWFHNTSHRESIRMAVLNQNLNSAFDLFELKPANEISFLDSYKKTLSKCCVDPLRPPRLSGAERQ